MFLPENIDLGQSEKYVLSIRIKPNGFMFAISEPEVGKNYCLRETTFSANDSLQNNIQRIIFDLNFLTQEFKQTNVVIVSSAYELVPPNYLEIKEKEHLYNFTHSEKAGHILSGLIEKQDIITLFNIEKDIYEFLSRNLWDPHFFHHTNLLISLLENKGKATEKSSKMYLNFHDGFMDIFCFSTSKLIHSHTYENEPVANQIYFVLKLWEKCGFNQIEDFLYITGKPDELIIIRLQEYIKHIERLNLPSEVYLWSEDAQKAPLDLLTLAL
ncbi:DUF3822 family protein [Dysgonomonas sp. Marseille-P4677]|uniref:DUF3822 family protein n=1 Tax=Dysgonomonas sp. Marseille-P4677 TaxID=2364790 RepID=UPI001914A89C|nr:DUF3822 family protein [Dysgonomonas sp. Marseille-P4677]MBK5721515.1 DUF3822 family protein [Dysgonomonas sp. Marseille-P4677]